MRKIVFAAGAAVLVLIIDAWLSIRTLTPISAAAGSIDNASVMTTGAKGLPTSPYDDYDIVVH
jgi:hypothetical protein